MIPKADSDNGQASKELRQVPPTTGPAAGPSKRESDANLSADFETIGPRMYLDLARIVAAWPNLPEPIRLAMLAMVDAVLA
jgi:hypothetical protein